MKRGEDIGRRGTWREKERAKGRDGAHSWMEGRGGAVKKRRRGLTASASPTGLPRHLHRLKLTSNDGAIDTAGPLRKEWVREEGRRPRERERGRARWRRCGSKEGAGREPGRAKPSLAGEQSGGTRGPASQRAVTWVNHVGVGVYQD
jgi:hypothetical protein